MLVPDGCIVNVMGLLISLQLTELSVSLIIFNTYYEILCSLTAVQMEPIVAFPWQQSTHIVDSYIYASNN
jgi:hypothetical protein